ncbi:MAG: YafY family transcriptional regulator [Anaerolineales bacterium]|nr:YafY family transcriptional regulator [Anaerolineales bacterium]
MRADRLLSLLMLLQTRGRMTAQELAERLEVSPRTIYRDLDALSGAGVPVYAERGPQGGVSLLENYRTNLTGLNEHEVRALFMLTVPGLLADLGAGDAAEQALLKLTAALPLPFQQDAELVRQRVYLDPAAWFAPEEPAPFLPLVQTAVWQQRRLRMTYRRGDGQWIKRLVDPYGLVAKASIWYFVGGAYGRPATFRVSRIQAAELTDSPFMRPPDFDLAAFWQRWAARLEADLSRYQVTVRVAPAGLPLLVQVFGEGMHALIANAGAPDDAGFLMLSLSFASEDEACRQLLGLGTAVTVIAPHSLRQCMAAAAVQISTLYA